MLTPGGVERALMAGDSARRETGECLRGESATPAAGDPLAAGAAGES